MVNRKILVGLLMIGVASATTAYGTFAFFSDTETSAGNLFTAGDLDLTLDGLNGVTATIVGTNFAPGDATSGSVLLRNEGSIYTGDAQGHLVDLDVAFSTTVTDDAGNLGDPDDGGVSATPFDRYLVLTTLTYGAQNLLPIVGDADGDGRAPTLADLDARGPILDLDDPGAAGRALALAVHFATDGPNHLKRDVVDLAATFFLAQAGEIDLGASAVDVLFVTAVDRATDSREPVFAEAGLTVEYSPTLPQDLTPYALVVFESYPASNAAAATALKAHVAAGGNVLLLTGTPSTLCSGDPRCLGWFGPSVSYWNTGGTARPTLAGPFDSTLTTADVLFTDPSPSGWGPAALRNVGGTATCIATWGNGNCYAVEAPTSGGRAAWLSVWGDLPGFPHGRALSVAALRWAAGL